MQRSSKIKYIWGAVILIILTLVILLGVHFFKNRSTSQKIVEEIPLVKTMTINAKGQSQSHTYSGDVRGRYESQLAFQVAGKIIRRNIDLGSVVKPGDVLMQIDPVDIRQGVDAKKAQVSAAESQFNLAKDNLERFKELYNEALMSQAEFDRYRNAYDSADAMLKQAKAQYALASNQLDYCKLITDKPGVVSAVYAEAGQVVAAGQPLVVLVKGSEREIEINVPEISIAGLNKDQTFKVTFWALPALAIEGKVREVSPVADAITRTYKVRISLNNPPVDLKLGMTATVTATGSDEQGSDLYIPLSAIYQTGDVPNVWMVNQGIATLKAVKVGVFGNDEQVQVLEGLKDGDVIVTAGVHKLREGEKVRIGGDVR